MSKNAGPGREQTITIRIRYDRADDKQVSQHDAEKVLRDLAEVLNVRRDAVIVMRSAKRSGRLYIGDFNAPGN